MGAGKVYSQFEVLEEPGEEKTEVITVDVYQSIDKVEEEAMAKIHQAIEEELVRDF